MTGPRREVEELLAELRDGLVDVGRLEEAAFVNCCAEVARVAAPRGAGRDRAPRDVFLGALQGFDPCRCAPCPDCGGQLGADVVGCACERCPSCGGLVDQGDGKGAPCGPPGPVSAAPGAA